MAYDLTVAKKQEMMQTIDGFVGTQNPDQKVVFLGQLGKFVEDQGWENSHAIRTTQAILYARLLDMLDRDKDKNTYGVVNRVILEYLKQAGIETD